MNGTDPQKMITMLLAAPATAAAARCSVAVLFWPKTTVR